MASFNRSRVVPKLTSFPFAQLDLFAFCRKPCALGHSYFIIRDADKALHFVPRVTLVNFCTSVPFYIMLLLDGLYPNGPILEICRKNKWDYMIVLQDKSLPSVWEEYEGLKKLEEKNQFSTTWGDRRQSFTWINGIEYFYGDNGRKRQMVNLVVCGERWEEVAKDSAQIVSKASRHAWISGKPLNKWNLHERCNLAARHRWNIESGILIEKRHGYHYEHLFSYNWNAMKGYHYLMRIGHLINILALYSERLAKTIRGLTMTGFIRFVRNTISGPWLDPLWVKRRLECPFQLRLI